jgi:outer membrane receptor protein involved in Fe transport
LRKLETGTVPVGGGLYALNGEIDGIDLKNEETTSVEFGYTGKLSDHVTLNVNTFYQRLSNLIGYNTTIDGFGLSHFKAANIDGADSYGGEVELAYQDKDKKLSAWYSYEHFELDQKNQPIRAFLPPTYKFGLTARFFLPADFVFNANYLFKDTTPKNPFVEVDDADIRSFNRLDLTISRKFAKGNGEFMLGVSDLFNKTNQAILETVVVSSHNMPGRTFFARVQLHF